MGSTDLPMTSVGTEAEMVMRVDPRRIRKAFMRIDSLRPSDCMERSAAMLPRRPPTEDGGLGRDGKQY